MRRAGVVTCALAACAAVMAIMASAALGRAVVPTDKGQVRGVETPTVKKYLGIPYAAPPVGDLRWRPPAACRPLVAGRSMRAGSEVTARSRLLRSGRPRPPRTACI